MVDLSIAIVAYKDNGDVEKAIASIAAYTPKDLSKVLYIIDNSANETGLKDLQARFDFVKYICTGKNLGFGGGHNYVLNMLNSKYHAIINPDIVLQNDAFSCLLRYMEEHRDVKMTVPKLTDESGEIIKAYRRELTVFDMFIRMFIKKGFNKRRDYHTMQDMDYSKPFRVPFAQGSFLVIDTAFFKELKGFDERFFLYMEDADLCRRVNEVSSLFYVPEAVAVHKWEKGSHKDNKLFKLHVSSMVKYFMKWGFKLF